MKDHPKFNLENSIKSTLSDPLPRLKKSLSTSSSPKLRRNVSFSTINIREYSRSLGDHPAVSSGPAVSIGWLYNEGPSMSLDSYESNRPYSRSKSEMVLSRNHREKILKEDYEYSRAEIAASVREINLVKARRRQTVNNLKMQRVEELLEKTKHGLAKVFLKRKSTKKEIMLLWKNTGKSQGTNSINNTTNINHDSSEYNSRSNNSFNRSVTLPLRANSFLRRSNSKKSDEIHIDSLDVSGSSSLKYLKTFNDDKNTRILLVPPNYNKKDEHLNNSSLLSPPKEEPTQTNDIIKSDDYNELDDSTLNRMKSLLLSPVEEGAHIQNDNAKTNGSILNSPSEGPTEMQRDKVSVSSNHDSSPLHTLQYPVSKTSETDLPCLRSLGTIKETSDGELNYEVGNKNVTKLKSHQSSSHHLSNVELIMPLTRRTSVRRASYDSVNSSNPHRASFNSIMGVEVDSLNSSTHRRSSCNSIIGIEDDDSSLDDALQKALNNEPDY